MDTLTLHEVLLTAKKQGATDVHYVVGSPPIMHMNGEFLPVDGALVTTADVASSLVSALLAPEDQPILAERREVVRAYTFPDGLRCRYRVFYQKGVPSLSFHILSEKIPTIDSLLLPDSVKRLSTEVRGLILVTGPHGSGRSSTAAALLQEINRTRATSIMTIESPIEYVIAGEKSIVEQREVGKDVPTYLQALKELVDADVEVVLLGGLDDDPAIIPAFLELAATRLVIVTFEATNSIKAIEHLITLVDQKEGGSVRTALADTLLAVISQRILSRPAGGRTAIVELLLGNDSAKAVVRDGKLVQLTNILQTSRAEGMVSLDQALIDAVRAGDVSQEEAIRQAVQPDYVSSLLARETK